MIPESKFASKDNSFWAAIRLISQEVGYTQRRQNLVKIPTQYEIFKCFSKLDLNAQSIVKDSSPTALTKE